MTSRSNGFFIALLVLACAAAGVAVSAQAPVDTATLGPQVGDVVPPVSGVDQHGRTQDLSTLAGPKGLMLVFNRSADW